MAKPRLSLAGRAKRDPQLLRRALKSPGLRSKLPSSMLTGHQRRQRVANTLRTRQQAAAGQKRARLNAPITPGSSLTERGLNRETRNALDVKYGPLEQQQRQGVGEAQAWQHDIGGYYDQYLKQIAQQAANVRAIGGQANTAMQGLQGGVTGLATADLKDVQGAANKDAAQRGTTAGDVSGMASNAAAIRQALVGSFAAQQTTQNAAAARYADTLANLVAPGQKLQAVAQAHGRVRQAREKQEATTQKRAADTATYRSQRRQEEFKNVLAQQTLGGSLASKAAGDKAERARLLEAARHNRAQENAQGQKVNAYGYTAREWAAMTPAEIAKAKALGRAAPGAGGQTPASIRAEKNRVAGLRGKSGKALGRIGTIGDEWNFLKTQPFTPPGKDKARKPQPSEMKAELRRKGYSADEIHLALMRPGTWGPREVEMAHRLGISVPRKYLLRSPTTYSKGANRPD